MKKLLIVFFLILIFINLWFAQCTAAPASQNPEINTFRLKQQVRLIIADHRFDYPDPLGWWSRLWDKSIGKFFGKFGKMTKDLFQKLIKWLMKLKSPAPARKGDWFSLIINYVGIACLILLPFLLVYYLPRMFRKEHRLKETHPETGMVSPKPLALLEEAAMMSVRSEFREAIRILYLAVLEDYKIRGVLPNGKVLSDKENLSLLRRYYGSDHPAYRAFDQIIRIFREKWYGLKNCQSPDYLTALTLSKIIMENTGKTNAKP